ncbi:MAG: hypothetical protein Q7R30_02310 [Acidobacteriota bacterium]|nr:hypothetical protein [Acidobacteriota bacterium]
MNTVVWASLAAIAVLWPGRLAGPLDGVPLDAPLEAAVIGVLLAWLVVAYARFLHQPAARALVIVLLLWKAGTSVALVQDGWCLRFTSPVPLFVEGVTVPHSWDVRADWRSPTPKCSAIMTSDYPELERFPAWFYNLPPANFRDPVRPGDRPPGATSRLDLDGFIDAKQPGVLRILAGEDIETTGTIDGIDFAKPDLEAGVPIGVGLHRILIRGDLRNTHWSLAPQWNGANVWSATTATIEPPSRMDRWFRPWGRLVPAALITGLVLCALMAIARRAQSMAVIGYAAGLASLVALLTLSGRDALLRAIPLLLIGAAAIKLPRRWQNLFGWSLLVGLPFLTLFVVMGVHRAGLFTWYSSGDDWWMFQRFAYRIYLQGFWLEGGQETFWFQPLYRWVAGGLHMIFGDSSVGELFWDAGAALTGAAFAFHVTRRFAGFRWGIVAAVTTLAVFTLGPGWYLFGRGMSEFTSAGFLYGAALFALRGRGGYWPAALAAGVLATLGFYTRLNNLPMALAVAAFALPMRQPIGDLFRPAMWSRRLSRPVLAGVLGALSVGLHLFTLRTWYYTSVYSMLFGTSTSVNTVWKAGEGLAMSLISSVMMHLTMNDPPRFDVRAVPILLGVAAAVLGVFRVGRFARLPLNLVVFCAAGVSSALVTRGTSYPGRFSIHLIPVTVALAVCAASLLVRLDPRSRSPHPAPQPPGTT